MAQSVYATTSNLLTNWFSTNKIYTYKELPSSCVILTDYTKDSYFLHRDNDDFAALEHLRPAIPKSVEPYTTRLIEIQIQYIPEHLL